MLNLFFGFKQADIEQCAWNFRHLGKNVGANSFIMWTFLGEANMDGVVIAIYLTLPDKSMFGIKGYCSIAVWMFSLLLELLVKTYSVILSKGMRLKLQTSPSKQGSMNAHPKPNCPKLQIKEFHPKKFHPGTPCQSSPLAMGPQPIFKWYYSLIECEDEVRLDIAGDCTQLSRIKSSKHTWRWR